MEQESFFFQALVYLASAVIIVPVAKRLGLGSVLGYLIAGIAIGPFCFGFIGTEGQDIMHFAEFGVVMMLFLIGLELQPQLLWRMRKSILGLGTLQVVVTTMVIGTIAYLSGLNFQQSAALGMIFSLSSTAIVMQTLQEKNLMRTAAGQSSFAVLLFQDIAVIPMIAAFPLLATLAPVHTGTGSQHSESWVQQQSAWLQTLFVLSAVSLIIVGGRILLKPLLRVIAKTRIREMFTASALLIVVGISVLMQQVGLSQALGAFLAGVVLANSEYRHELESDIEPFKGLLLGLFFIAVGASIDFHVIANHPFLIAGWVFLVILLKSAVQFFLGGLFGLSRRQNFIFALSISQVGEFAFVLFSFALRGGILDAATVNMMMAVTAISMALTPMVMLLNEKVILPKLGQKETDTREADEINVRNPVIIAGFGDFGSTVGRFLRANKINATYLDTDSDTVDALGKLGFKVFYGDASRVDLLHSAGAAEARLIIIAIDDEEKRLEMIDTVKKHFPNLHMMVRATNRNDAYDQMNAGMLHVYRDTLDTSLRMGVDAMSLLGRRKYTASRLAKTFLKHDEKNLKKLAAIRNDSDYILEVKKHIEEIELIIQADLDDKSLTLDTEWDAQTLRDEFGKN